MRLLVLIALALCAPVAAHAEVDSVTAANFDERYAATEDLMTKFGSTHNVCYTPDQGVSGCMTMMVMQDVPHGTVYSIHHWKTDFIDLRFMCTGPLAGGDRNCVNQFGLHTQEHYDGAAGMWRTVGSFKR